jgi:hypothetical protein
VDLLEGSGSDKVKIGLVPFSNYVNVGMDNRDASWIDVPADSSRTENYQYQPQTQTGFRTCTGSVERTGTYNIDGASSTYTYNELTGCSGADTWENSGPEETRSRTITETWSGCVGSRDSGLHLRDASYASRIPGLMNTSCAAEILPLTKDYTAIRTRLGELNAKGNTYLPAGLAWGQRALSPQEPYAEGATDTIKYLVLMTDGENTLSLNVPEHNGSDTGETDKDTQRLCTDIKADDITVFTIAFMVDDTATQNILKKCASNGTTYFRADDADGLNEAFTSIANSVLSARLTQ